MFWLSGSQLFHLMQGVSESLAGRVGIVQLLGLSRCELLGRPERREPFLPTLEKEQPRLAPLALQELYRHIWRGAYPGLVLSAEKDRDLFYSSYVQTYLQRDVRELARVGDEMSFLSFMRVAAARTAQLLNLSEMARDADVSPNTAKNWLSILQTSGIVYLLEPYHTNVTKRLVKTPKLYFLDTGLAAYLTEWTTPETLEAGAMSGPILETWILAELLKSYWHNGQRAPFYFYRDKDKKEIDLLIVRDGKIYPVEFKKTASPGKKDLRNFGVLDRLGVPVEQGGLICLVEQSLPLSSAVHTIPVGWL
jgi:predicted AAA+ superfamily ATPase